MNKFITYIKYELKIFLGNLGNMFWMMIFPLLLLTVFSVVFSGLRFIETDLEKAEIGYHEDAYFPLKAIGLTENSMDLNNIILMDNSKVEHELFKGKLMDYNQGIQNLEDGKIDAYVEKNLDLVINENGIKQRMMDEILTMYKQIEKLQLPMTAYEFDRAFVKEMGNKYSPIDVIFYSLFAMMSLYGSYLSSSIGNRLIVRDKKVSLRNTTSSTPMAWQILISVITCFLWSSLMVLFMVVYSELILGQHFFSLDFYNIPLMASAIVFGISWGLFIGTFVKKESTQIATVIGTLLAMSGLSGLYGDGIRILVQRIFPAINYVNPVTIIGNELIKINMLSNYSTVLQSFGILMGFSILLTGISTVYIRRKKA